MCSLDFLSAFFEIEPKPIGQFDQFWSTQTLVLEFRDFCLKSYFCWFYGFSWVIWTNWDPIIVIRTLIYDFYPWPEISPNFVKLPKYPSSIRNKGFALIRSRKAENRAYLNFWRHELSQGLDFLTRSLKTPSKFHNFPKYPSSPRRGIFIFYHLT